MRFNPRARAGRDYRRRLRGVRPGVSIHAPVRGATAWNAQPGNSVQFQSTRPCGARRTVDDKKIQDLKFQSTRPCGARRWHHAEYRRPGAVSIHAPVRGATAGAPTVEQAVGVSIHAPVRGATRLSFSACMNYVVSIHAPVRGATNYVLVIDSPGLVSIHAPVRGATNWYEQKLADRRVSIHAPVRGATFFGLISVFTSVFQSTRPCGARQRSSRFSSRRSAFQSTRPCGARLGWFP